MKVHKEDKRWCLYSIRNKETQKVYFGISCNLKDRWKHHRLHAKHGKGYYLHSALSLYGDDAFTWSVEKSSLTRQEACDQEMAAIASARLNEGVYNLTKGGEFPPEQCCSPQSIEKRSAKLRGVPLSEEHKKAISIAHKGKKRTPEHTQNHIAALLSSEKMQAAWKALNGVSHTPERVQNITIAQRNRREREKNSPDYELRKAEENAKRSATWAKKREEKLKAKYVPVRLNLLSKDDTIPE